MRRLPARRLSLVGAAALVVTIVGSGPARAEELTLHLDPAESRLTFLLEATGHDVHGEMALADGEIRFDPAAGSATGDVRVDSAATETGKKSRDETMHEEVLLSGRFPLISLHVDGFRGILDPEAGGDITLEGRIDLVGHEHPVAIPAHVTIDGDHLHAVGSFEVPFVAWGLHDPSILFLRVAKVVKLDLVVEGTLGRRSA